MMSNATPLVSVIIPVYNPGRHLYRCLNSITHQTYRNLEIILINDGSTDDSLNVCRSYAEKDSRIQVFTQENAGVSVARNRGIEAATGDWYSFIDSDDFLEENTYEFLLDIAKKEKPDIVCFEYFVTFPNHETQHAFRDKSRYGLKNRTQAIREQTTGVPFAWCKLFSKKVIGSLRFQVGLARGEDGEFARLAIHKADTVYYAEQPLLHYVQSDESAVRGVFRVSQLSILDNEPKTDSFYRQNYPELLPYHFKSYLHICVMLYCDMYADKKPYPQEQKRTYRCFCKARKEVPSSFLTTKEQIKFLFFRIAPKTFAFIHMKRQ